MQILYEKSFCFAVKNQNTGLKLVRQYRGHFLVVGGNLLEFDSDLLDTDSATFKNKVKVYERKVRQLKSAFNFDKMKSRFFFRLIRYFTKAVWQRFTKVRK